MPSDDSPGPELQPSHWSRRLGLPTGLEAFPYQQGILLAMAAVVGVYGGLAAGLFSNFIALFQTVFFRTHALVQGVLGEDPGWRRAFRQNLATASWHFEFLLVGSLVIGVGLLVPVIEKRRPFITRYIEPHVIQAVSYLLGFGLWLYYPLLALATFNRSFREMHGGFLGSLEASPWLVRLVIPGVGALLVGLLLKYVTPESSGHGVAEVIEAVVVPDRHIPGRVAFWKSVTAGLTIGSGGSAGREGPVVQMGAAVGSALSSRFGLSREDMRLLLACGGGAGIAASFNAPIAGSMFALEIILGDFGVRSFSPIVVAAVAATITSRTLIGAGGELEHIQYSVKSAFEVGSYALLGIFCALVAVTYVRAVGAGERFFAGHGGTSLSKRVGALPFEVRTLLAGLCVGAIGVFVPRVMGNGYETMNSALSEQLPVYTLLLVLALKIIATALTLGSGTPGGSFFPAVFLGAMTGGAFGAGLHDLFPSVTASSQAYAAVGMAAVVAGATQGPLTAVIMLFELTGSYEVVLPLMIACSVAVGGARFVLGGSMYTLRLKEKGIALGRATQQRVLTTMRVGQAMSREVVSVKESTSFADVVALHLSTNHNSFPVVDAAGRLVGLLTVDDVRPFIGDRALQALVVARDACREHPPTVRPNDTLEMALLTMATSRADHLPVVSPEDPAQLVGFLTRRDIIDAYHGAVADLRTSEQPSLHGATDRNPART